ncbi:DNA polymerase-3 subunit epsilon [Alteribacillus persepolensis]|uniref:DNA polymerase-3 subunit epsilon n=1 Tax=Alteribacillus persepolensis TaxID=568899 RepID=A0A1G8G6U3_9BACI|nr:exonuclease domain-containing protein [Alteribacillus persepolensis]SDH90010.1 DNA polymerase-3 subunit epsilon [Alteribacillus persepolensis]
MVMNHMYHWVRQVSGKLGAPFISSMDQNNPQHLSFLRQLQKDLKADEPLSKPLDTLNIAVLDLETSGFYPDGGDKILSMGAVKIQKGEVKEEQTFYTPVCEPASLSPEVAALTGLTKEELESAPLLPEALQKFYAFIQTDILVAHHARHEQRFLQHATFQAMGSQFQHRLLDTSFLFNIAAPHVSSVELEGCCQYYDIPVQNRHHALEDALLAAELWNRSMKDVQKKGYETLQDVYVHLNKQQR